VPGDPVRVFLGEFASEEQIVAAQHKLGLDRPLHVQYVSWLTGIVRGDFGVSLALNLPVSKLILERIPRTLELTLVAIVLALLMGVPLGVSAALRRGTALDVGLTMSSLVALSVPIYVSGTIFVLLFAVRLRWLPASGFVNFAEDPRRHVLLLILPAFTLALYLAASIARMTRSSVLEVINQDYVRTARSKGLRNSVVITRHVMRNAVIPIATIVGIQAGNLLGGAIIAEQIFAWPGLSSLIFQAITTRDFPVVQGTVLVISSLFILFTVIVDVFNGIVDPRVAHGARG
jgi:peptide/nickel transport system permease protein